MKCSECNVEIPPAWKHCYEINHCPSCGGKIFNEQTLDLMNGLKSALEQMPNDPQGIAGWLLSNYRMEKVGDGEPTGFYGKNTAVPKEDSEIKVAANAESKLEKFYKRAGVDPIKNPKNRMAILAKQIASLGEEGEASNEPDMPEDDEFIEEAEDPEFTKAVLRGMESDGESLSPNEIKSLKNIADSEFSNSELDDIPAYLHQDRKLRLLKQQELSVGGKIGKIRRSE